jgi:hypothetical protein
LTDDTPTLAVALAMPHYGDVKAAAAKSYWTATGADSRFRLVLRADRGGSLLTSNFNRAWCAALNARAKHGITHFAMLHADIAAEPGWLDTLLREMELYRADVVSAVVPLKTEHGVTSTAIGTPNPFVQRRLTMHEVMRLPATFGERDTASHFGFASGNSGPLLVNTGCLLADLRKPWAHEVDADGRLKWCFRFENEIRLNRETGEYVSFVASEDWLFSHHLADVGAKVYATRKVKAEHIGSHNYPNHCEWGEWQSDEAFASVAAEVLGTLARKGGAGEVSPAIPLGESKGKG